MPTADHPPPELERLTSRWLRSFRQRLLRWHCRAGRQLPWRGANPYRVWISEIMLQQTTVAAVIPYYERFLQTFPTVAALAQAPESQVLKLWEGLGYYSRARNLHKAAQVIVEDHGGDLPSDLATLQSLPGIGRYTAGAIASFAYDIPAPIVEANTLRLYSRLLNFEGDPRAASGQKLLWDFAERLLPRTAPGEFNQALTDLGATVCLPGEPNCPACPVQMLCGAFQAGSQREVPRPAKRPGLTDITECAVVVRHRGRCLLRQCQPGERWPGLWDFPRFAIDQDVAARLLPNLSEAEVPEWLAAEAATGVARQTGVHSTITAPLGQLRHGVTRYRITLLCLEATVDAAQSRKLAPHLQWAPLRDLPQIPLSKTGREIVDRWIAPR